MNKIIFILCSVIFLSPFNYSGFSMEKIYSCENNLSSDPINKIIYPDSLQTKTILEKILARDSLKYKKQTDTVKKRVRLDSTQTKRVLEKYMSEIVKTKKKTQIDIEYEIDGLIVAKTISRAGRDFYDIFYSGWETPKGINNYIIEIKEKPIPQMGTEITLVVKEFVIFQEKLPPRYDVIEEYAKYAIYLVTEFLNNYKKILNELNGDDMSGSGIF